MVDNILSLNTLEMIVKPNINTWLPAELLVQILGLLGAQDLKTCMLVCHLWTEVGQAPGLWSWVVVRAMGSLDDMALVADMLASRRLHKVRDVDLYQCDEEVAQLLEVVVSHRRLRRLSFLDCRLSAVSSSLLVRAVEAAEEVDIVESTMTERQMEDILKAVAGETQVSILNLRDTDLPLVPAGLVARALNNLHTVDITATRLSRLQAEAIFQQICEGSKLRKIILDLNPSISHVNKNLLARALTSLKEVNLDMVVLTNEQVRQICTKICSGNSKLRYLSIQARFNMDKELLARALNKLVRVKLSLFKKQTEQVVAQSLVKTSLINLSVNVIDKPVDEALVTKAKMAINTLSVITMGSKKRTVDKKKQLSARHRELIKLSHQQHI